MARVKNLEQAREDTVRLCQTIKTATGLTDKEVEIQLGVAGEIEATGRRFNRWLKGQNVMTPDMLQQVAREARKKGWVKNAGALKSLYHDRAGLITKTKTLWNSGLIAAHNVRVKRIHAAQKAVMEALHELHQSIQADQDVVLVNTTATDHEQNEFRSSEILEMMCRIEQVHLFDLSPWARAVG